YKIGYQLAFAGGIDFARVLASAGKRVFLDLKLHDIGNAVARGVESVARLGASFLTVHAYPQTMHAAVDARKGSALRLLAVTVLPSYDDADLAAAGYDFTVSELVAERAAQARDVGIDGLVCSGEEAALLRPMIGAGMVLVTPGIRPFGAAAGDQKRIMTPAAAIAAGAAHLVLRPPTRAPPGARHPRNWPPGGSHEGGAEVAKGYGIPHIDVSGREGYKAYVAAPPPAHDKYRGRALVRGGAQEVVEGRSRSRNVLRE